MTKPYNPLDNYKKYWRSTKWGKKDNLFKEKFKEKLFIIYKKFCEEISKNFNIPYNDDHVKVYNPRNLSKKYEDYDNIYCIIGMTLIYREYKQIFRSNINFSDYYDYDIIINDDILYNSKKQTFNFSIGTAKYSIEDNLGIILTLMLKLKYKFNRKK